jgi:hypothetical protein
MPCMISLGNMSSTGYLKYFEKEFDAKKIVYER